MIPASTLTSVLTFGEPMVVCIPETRGRLSAVDQYRMDCAGAELNTAIGLARLGIPVSFAASVGDDPFGERIRCALRGAGVDTRLVETAAEGATGLYFKQWSGLRGDTQVFYYRKTSPMALGAWQTDPVLATLRSKQYGWVHATGITWMLGEPARVHAEALLTEAAAQQLPVSFDINIRLKLAPLDAWRALLISVLPRVRWLLLGDTEAALLFGTDEPAEVEQRARADGFAGLGVLVKQGERGATTSVTGELTSVPAFPVDTVVDTVGAGDGFNAGWIAGMLLDLDATAALRLGAYVGACAVTGSGDWREYPDWHDAKLALHGESGVSR